MILTVWNLDLSLLVLISLGAMIMTLTVLRAIAQGSVGLAADIITERRAVEARRREENAAAEAAGRAAALEPLALNADGTIEEPVLGVVETPGV